MPFYRRKRFIALYIAALLFARLQFQVPSNEGPWNQAQVRTSWVEFDDRRLTVHNLRDFRYGADLRAVSADFVDQDLTWITCNAHGLGCRISGQWVWRTLF